MANAIRYYSNYEEHTMSWSFGSPIMTLAQNTVLSYTVPGEPTQEFQAKFSYASNSNVFVGLNATVAVPSSGTATTTGRAEYKPDKRVVHGGDVLYFITPDTNAYMGVSLRTTP